MMKNFIFYSTIVGLVLITSCSSKKSEKEELLFETQNPDQIVNRQDTSSSTKFPIGDTSKTSLDWDGTYVGTLPCADCQGVKTRLTLTKESTYILTQEYLDKNKKNIEDGTFTWDDKGSEIILDKKGKLQRFKVGENKVIKLDKDGKPIAGKRSEDYTLLKE